MKAWLFDLDGTLLDTAPDLHRALSALLSEQGREPIPLEVMRRYVSRGARGLVRLAFGELDDDTELTTRLVEIYAQDIASETRLFDELDVLLASLRSGGLRWGIVTNKLEALARQVLESMPQAALLHDCALLIGLRNRHRRVDASVQDSFSPCLTQEQIGDATGLTAVHVNRMLRQLEDEGLLARDGGRITFLNEHALARTAHHIDRTQHIDLGWLPPAR